MKSSKEDSARILVSLKDGFLKEIDFYSEKNFMTRSEFIRNACRDYMKKLECDNHKSE